MATKLTLIPGQLTLTDLRQVYDSAVHLRIEDVAWQSIDRSRAIVDNIVASGATVYGVNTGFGRLAQTRIDREQLATLQTNLVLSHATGVGAMLADDIVRLILVLKINALAQGFSGVTREVIQLLVDMVNFELYPIVPSKGSVGASGDLAPLAHLSLPLIGKGQVRAGGELQDSLAAFNKAGLKPVQLAAKDGLGLLNGTQVSTALALKGLFQAEQNMDAAFIAGSMTVEAALGSRVPFDETIHEIRGHPGQIEAARIYRSLLDASEIGHSHANCDRVQDPYSLRCQPQVMGACLEQLKTVAGCLQIEANAVSDNPLPGLGLGAWGW